MFGDLGCKLKITPFFISWGYRGIQQISKSASGSLVSIQDLLKGNKVIPTTRWECVSMLAVMSMEGSVCCSEKRPPLCDTVIRTETNMK
jgi:hypothetical protein